MVDLAPGSTVKVVNPSTVVETSAPGMVRSFVLLAGTPGQPGEDGLGVPPGGFTGQVLAKNTDADNDTEWVTPADPEPELPAGGTTGQVLAKNTGADRDVKWVDPPTPGGTTSTAPLAFVTRTSTATGGATYSTTATTATDIDATNLAVTFTVPASGAVTVAFEGYMDVGTVFGFLSLRSGGANVTGTNRQVLGTSGIGKRLRTTWRITGLTPGATQSYTVAWRVNLSSSSMTMDYGGANSAEFTGDHKGPIYFEVWAA